MLKEKLLKAVKEDIIEYIFQNYFQEILDDKTQEAIIKGISSILKEHFPIGQYQGQVYFTEDLMLNIETRELSIDSEIYKIVLNTENNEISFI